MNCAWKTICQTIIRIFYKEELARNYFRKHDDYPFGYECLCISRSREVVNQGLEKLLEGFYDSYQVYYRRYRKMVRNGSRNKSAGGVSNGRRIKYPPVKEKSVFYQRYSRVSTISMLMDLGFSVSEAQIDNEDIVYMEQYKEFLLNKGWKKKFLLNENL